MYNPRSPIASLLVDTRSHVPPIIVASLKYFQHHGVDEEGLMRLSGNHTHTQDLIREFDDGSRSSFEPSLDPYDVADAFKHCLRKLNPPLIPNNLYESFTEALALEERDSRVREVASLLQEVSPIDRTVIAHVVLLLQRIVDCEAVTKMGVKNCALIFGPTLLPVPMTDRRSATKEMMEKWMKDSKYQVEMVSLLITQLDHLLPDKVPSVDELWEQYNQSQTDGQSKSKRKGSMQRRLCPDGEACTVYDAEHFLEFSHSARPLCPQGAQCLSCEPEHYVTFRHTLTAQEKAVETRRASDADVLAISPPELPPMVSAPVMPARKDLVEDVHISNPIRKHQTEGLSLSNPTRVHRKTHAGGGGQARARPNGRPGRLHTALARNNNAAEEGRLHRSHETVTPSSPMRKPTPPPNTTTRQRPPIPRGGRPGTVVAARAPPLLPCTKSAGDDGGGGGDRGHTSTIPPRALSVPPPRIPVRSDEAGGMARVGGVGTSMSSRSPALEKDLSLPRILLLHMPRVLLRSQTTGKFIGLEGTARLSATHSGLHVLSSWRSDRELWVMEHLHRASDLVAVRSITTGKYWRCAPWPPSSSPSKKGMGGGGDVEVTCSARGIVEASAFRISFGDGADGGGGTFCMTTKEGLALCISPDGNVYASPTRGAEAFRVCLRVALVEQSSGETAYATLTHHLHTHRIRLRVKPGLWEMCYLEAVSDAHASLARYSKLTGKRYWTVRGAELDASAKLVDDESTLFHVHWQESPDKHTSNPGHYRYCSLKSVASGAMVTVRHSEIALGGGNGAKEENAVFRLRFYPF